MSRQRNWISHVIHYAYILRTQYGISAMCNCDRTRHGCLRNLCRHLWLPARDCHSQVIGKSCRSFDELWINWCVERVWIIVRPTIRSKLALNAFLHTESARTWDCWRVIEFNGVHCSQSHAGSQRCVVHCFGKADTECGRHARTHARWGVRILPVLNSGWIYPLNRNVSKTPTRCNTNGEFLFFREYNCIIIITI